MSEKVFKVVMLGASGSGKTSLRNNFLYKNYTWQHLPTCNPDFVSTHVVPDSGGIAAIQIWDTGGVSVDRLTTASLAEDADAIILVVDGSRAESLDSLSRLLSGLANVFTASGLPVVLVMSKVDLPQNVSCEKAIELCKSVAGHNLDIVCIEASACTGKNVDCVFQRTAELCQTKAFGSSAVELDERPLLLKTRVSRHGDPICYHRFDIDDSLQAKGHSRHVADAVGNRARYILRRLLCLG
ncbi:hypothetical protein EV177_003703 [Coemansia sp. RSA 1804]|nr:hypothetical protein EV177_003703 [Coemansia sp. RSA 1804]